MKLYRNFFPSRNSTKGTMVLSRLPRYFPVLIYSEYKTKIVTSLVCTRTRVMSSQYHIAISLWIYYNIDSEKHWTVVTDSKRIRNNMQTLEINVTDVRGIRLNTTWSHQMIISLILQLKVRESYTILPNQVGRILKCLWRIQLPRISFTFHCYTHVCYM